MSEERPISGGLPGEKYVDKSGCEYTQSVYPDYYTSKTYPKGDTHHTILSPQSSVDAGTEGIDDLSWRGLLHADGSSSRRRSI